MNIKDIYVKVCNQDPDGFANYNILDVQLNEFETEPNQYENRMMGYNGTPSLENSDYDFDNLTIEETWSISDLWDEYDFYREDDRRISLTEYILREKDVRDFIAAQEHIEEPFSKDVIYLNGEAEIEFSEIDARISLKEIFSEGFILFRNLSDHPIKIIDYIEEDILDEETILRNYR